MTLQDLLPWGKRDPNSEANTQAREFVDRAYNAAGGPTQELKRVYDAFLANERRKDGPAR